MSSSNTGWLFYKDYFKGINYGNLDDSSNETLIQGKAEQLLAVEPDIPVSDLLGSIRFQGITTYPGLLLGSGNAHEIPSVKGQLILGFHFDYTSGIPVIQGSSIKGVLRSAFKHPEYIQEYLSSDIDIEELEAEIFNNADVFFDAEIIKADKFGKILGDDYITPHDDALKDPIPLRFLKVLPDVTFLFQFELNDGLLSKLEKETLFRNILSDLGIGAKTNVGYGKFNISDAPKTDEEIKREKEAEVLKKQQDIETREKNEKEAKEEKAKKAEDGIASLATCKSLSDSMKIINNALGKKAKPTPEQKEIIQKFYNKSKEKKTKQIEKFFKKIIDI